jgi:hypothetical protein
MLAITDIPGVVVVQYLKLYLTFPKFPILQFQVICGASVDRSYMFPPLIFVRIETNNGNDLVTRPMVYVRDRCILTLW